MKKKYLEFSQKELEHKLILEEIFIDSKYTVEKMRVLILKPREMKNKPSCLILLHGIRDCAEDGINKAKIKENYLTLREKGRVEDIVFILPDSGYKGERGDTNFYKEKNNQDEEGGEKDRGEQIDKEDPESGKGRAGGSRGGQGVL